MTDVKICGITRRQDALLAVELGAWAVGFVFWPGSPRYCDPRIARAIINALPPTVVTAGVFVDQPAGHVRMVAEESGITTIQLHGRESVLFAQSLGRPVFRAVAVTNGFTAESLDEIPSDITVLLDAFDPATHGGTGRTIDWSAAASAASRRPVILAGGLNAGNIAEAVRHVRPRAVDLSSGVESAPGVKDAAQLHAFFHALHHD